MDTKSKSYADEKRWVAIYPVYINSRKTVKDGRRIPKTRAVDTPTAQEIHDILVSAGLKVALERKMYPRDPNRDLHQQGRVRVQLKNDDGTPFDARFPDRYSLYFYVAEMIPKLKTRQSGGGGGTAGGSQGLAGSSGGGGGKKGNKKKK